MQDVGRCASRLSEVRYYDSYSPASRTDPLMRTPDRPRQKAWKGNRAGLGRCADASHCRSMAVGGL